MRVVITIFDNSAAKTDLGFRCSIPWVYRVGRTVDWLDAHGQVEDSDEYPFYDRILRAWERLGTQMAQEFVSL